VTEHIRTLNKFVCGRFDSQLYFANELFFEHNVDENVIRTHLKSVFDSDYFDKLRLIFTYLLKLFEYSKNLSLFGAALASHQITHFETHQIGRRSPAIFCR